MIPKKFKDCRNTFAFTCDSANGGPIREADLFVNGDLNQLADGIAQKMQAHPDIAYLFLMSVYLFKEHTRIKRKSKNQKNPSP